MKLVKKNESDDIEKSITKSTNENEDLLDERKEISKQLEHRRKEKKRLNDDGDQ